jgi:Ca-activated chloride channel homolog
VSFDSPERLILILAPIAMIVAYFIAQRARRKNALRFTSVDLLASVAPKRSGWQRHVSAVLLVLAVAALVVGFAEPTKDKKVPKQTGTIMMVIDTSGSMSADDVAPSRLVAAQAAAKQFAEALPPGLRVGLISFDTSPRVLVAPTPDRATINAAIDGLVIGGGTATGPAMTTALQAIDAIPPEPNGDKPAAAMVLMSDGTPTIGSGGRSPESIVSEATATAKEKDVPINTIAFGTPYGTIERDGETIPVPADPSVMKEIADGSGGKSFTAETAGELQSVYEQIRKSVGYDTVQEPIVVWFTGLGLLLALLTAGAALYWLQRMP